MKITVCRLDRSVSRPNDLPPVRRPEIAFMGRSNVGKSSLINRLLGVRGLARTSKSPGRTQAIHFFAIDEKLHFVDLPGYGYARVPEAMRAHWKGLVEAYLDGPGRPTLAIQLVDARHEPTAQDAQLLEWLRARDVRHEVVLTKIDKLSGNGRAQAMHRFRRWLGLPPSARPIAVSALTGDGIPSLWRVIADAIGDRRLHDVETPPSGGIFAADSAAPDRSTRPRGDEPKTLEKVSHRFQGGRITL